MSIPVQSPSLSARTRSAQSSQDRVWLAGVVVLALLLVFQLAGPATHVWENTLMPLMAADWVQSEGSSEGAAVPANREISSPVAAR